MTTVYMFFFASWLDLFALKHGKQEKITRLPSAIFRQGLEWWNGRMILLEFQ